MPYQTDSPALAVIDIGSNSVRMVIYDVQHSPPVKTFNEKVFCALGRDLASTGLLHPEGVIAACKAIKAYHMICDVQHIQHVEIVGTAALRDAKDGTAFIKIIKEETGLDIRVISGDAEARYAARGVLMDTPQASGVVADFGGGSLEFARLEQGHITDTISLPLGAYRVMALDDPKEVSFARFLDPIFVRFGQLSHFYAIGGSWRALAGAHQLEHKSTSAHIAPDVMIDFCRKVERMTTEDLQSLYQPDQSLL